MALLQNAMIVAGIVTLIQLYSVGPIGGQIPIIMGTSSGFIGVFNSVAASMGGGVIAYGAIMGAPEVIRLIFDGSGIVPAAVIAIILNVLIPEPKKEAEELIKTVIEREPVKNEVIIFHRLFLSCDLPGGQSLW